MRDAFRKPVTIGAALCATFAIGLVGGGGALAVDGELDVCRRLPVHLVLLLGVERSSDPLVASRGDTVTGFLQLALPATTPGALAGSCPDSGAATLLGSAPALLSSPARGVFRILDERVIAVAIHDARSAVFHAQLSRGGDVVSWQYAWRKGTISGAGARP